MKSVICTWFSLVTQAQAEAQAQTQGSKRFFLFALRLAFALPQVKTRYHITQAHG